MNDLGCNVARLYFPRCILIVIRTVHHLGGINDEGNSEHCDRQGKDASEGYWESHDR